METEPNIIEVLSNPIVMGAIVVYFMPTLFAIYNKSAAWAICFGINLLFGWTFIGWIVAIVLAAGPSKDQLAYRNRVKCAQDNFYLREDVKAKS